MTSKDLDATREDGARAKKDGQFPDEIFVTTNGEGDFFGYESPDDINADHHGSPLVRYRLVEVGTLVVEARFQPTNAEPLP